MFVADPTNAMEKIYVNLDMTLLKMDCKCKSLLGFFTVFHYYTINTVVLLLIHINLCDLW